MEKLRSLAYKYIKNLINRWNYVTLSVIFVFIPSSYLQMYSLIVTLFGILILCFSNTPHCRTELYTRGITSLVQSVGTYALKEIKAGSILINAKDTIKGTNLNIANPRFLGIV